MPIQGDSGGDNTGHCDKKSSHEHCLIVNGYRDTAVCIYKQKSIVYYYYYYLMQISFHWVAVVLKLVQTKNKNKYT